MSKIFISYNWIKQVERGYRFGNDYMNRATPSELKTIEKFVEIVSKSNHFIITDNYPSDLDEWEEAGWDAENVVKIHSLPWRADISTRLRWPDLNLIFGEEES